MLIAFINKAMFLLFFMACLNIIRHSYFFVQAFLTSTEEVPVKYRLAPEALLYLGLSIAYMLASIFTGIKI